MVFFHIFVSSLFLCFLCDKNMREKEGLHGWFEVPISLKKILQSRDQRLMSCREKGKRKDCLLLLFFFQFIFSLFYDFSVIKIWERKRDGMMDLYSNELGHGDLILDMIWSCSDERRRKKEGLLLRFLLESFFSINHEIFLWKKLDIIRSGN